MTVGAQKRHVFEAVVGAVTVHVMERAQRSAATRLGIVVDRSAGGAVVRNAIKRRIREAFRACSARPGNDIVVRGDGSVRATSYQELVMHLKGALTRAGAL